MTLLLPLAFLFVIIAIYLSTTGLDIEVRNSRYAATAQQMIYYHSASARVCGESCAGDIDPTNELATFRRGQGPLAHNASFRSVAQNGYVITYYVAGSSASEVTADQAGVMAAIMSLKERDTEMFVGQYDQAAGKLRARSQSYWVDPITGASTQTNAQEANIGSISAPNGAPVIISQF